MSREVEMQMFVGVAPFLDSLVWAEQLMTQLRSLMRLYVHFDSLTGDDE